MVRAKINTSLLALLLALAIIRPLMASDDNPTKPAAPLPSLSLSEYYKGVSLDEVLAATEKFRRSLPQIFTQKEAEGRARALGLAARQNLVMLDQIVGRLLLEPNLAPADQKALIERFFINYRSTLEILQILYSLPGSVYRDRSTTYSMTLPRLKEKLWLFRFSPTLAGAYLSYSYFLGKLAISVDALCKGAGAAVLAVAYTMIAEAIYVNGFRKNFYKNESSSGNVTNVTFPKLPFFSQRSSQKSERQIASAFSEGFGQPELENVYRWESQAHELLRLLDGLHRSLTSCTLALTAPTTESLGLVKK